MYQQIFLNQKPNYMESIRICIGCGETFLSRRINHVYCTTDCKSNSHNNDYKEENAIQRSILIAKKKQDELLDEIYYSSNQEIYFDEHYLEHHGIYIANAKKQTLDSNNSLLTIEFLNYALTRTASNNHFKLIKL